MLITTVSFHIKTTLCQSFLLYLRTTHDTASTLFTFEWKNTPPFAFSVSPSIVKTGMMLQNEHFFLFSVFPSIVKTGLILENSIPSAWLLKNKALRYHLVLRQRWESFVGCVTALYFFKSIICIIETKNSNFFSSFFVVVDRLGVFVCNFNVCFFSFFFFFFSFPFVWSLIWKSNTDVALSLMINGPQYDNICILFYAYPVGRSERTVLFLSNLSLDVHSLKTLHVKHVG